ncbi:hybrid sensor histidine kinase/response regulator transcription factor [Mangrovibacterium marinum]|uniref:histidine kinase n=1 Tax=Mangrovibacterium marinum TaxID=1639118 RepID=A0A2T5BYW6_9BACT|nr:hybrid sensor histidine kinase/response regulator transcription factor [Mangrovibacterium marinum]PTN07448.1 signal transduction histidine kinase [Mangrovibacterium marinum]
MQGILRKYRREICFAVLFLFALLTVQKRGWAQAEDPIHFIHYTSEDGLPSTYVKSIVQDADGFIWAATRSAVVRFDGSNFQHYSFYDADNNPIEEYCDKLFFTPDSDLIVRSNNEEYFYYDKVLERFYPYSLLTDLGPTNTVVPEKDGFWICQNDEIFFLNKLTRKRKSLREKLDLFQLPPNEALFSLVVQSKWIAFASRQGAIYAYHNKRLKSYPVPEGLNAANFELRFIDSRGDLWIHSNDYGLACLDLATGHFSLYTNQRNDSYHLPHNLVHCFAEDFTGRVWIGTEAGLAIYDPDNDTLKLHRYRLSEPHGLNTDPIYDAFCDQQGNIWLGTYFGGINFWSGQQSFFRTWTSGFGKWQLSGNVVSCLEEDKQGNLWIGLEDKGLNKLDMKTGEMTHYCSTEGAIRLSYDNVHDLLFVDDNELWIGTYTGGINVLNTKTNRVKYYNRLNTNNVVPDVIYQFQKVGTKVYIATSEGIVVYDRETQAFSRLKPDVTNYIQFESIAQNGKSLWFTSSKQIFRYDPENDLIAPFQLHDGIRVVNFVKTDSKGRSWFGTCYSGLFCVDEPTGEVKHFDAANRFPAQWIFSLEEGQNGWFWVSTDRGLIKLNPETNESYLYDSNSGIPFNQFNYRASFTDSKGNIYFGGNNGMVSFNEDDETIAEKQLPIAFTELELFNQTVSPGELNCLDQSINQTDELVLKYNQNVFTLGFTAFSYSTGGKFQYSYYLEGFESEWNNVGNRNFATYTNLSPGKYTFRVKGTLGDNQTGLERQLKITVLPPFWLTGWAYFIYVLIIIGIFILVFLVGSRLEKTKARAELEHREKIHADELHQVKLEFFTNISHELKTPLTLILAPIHKLLQEEQLSPAIHKKLAGIERSADRLFQLINQLLEFRKIERGKEDLRVSPCHVRQMIEALSSSFNNLAETKDIDFQLEFEDADQLAWLDVNKIDKIVFNLLSNAFKFTPDGGTIKFAVQLVRRSPRSSDELTDLVLTVSDSGKGIKPEMVGQVFDRFFHIEDESTPNVGTGIGLAYVKSLVILMRGSISVDSIVNKGTIFTVTLPVSKSDFTPGEIDTEPVQYRTSMSLPEEKQVVRGKGENLNLEALSSKPRVLLVEDNPDLVDFLKTTLEDRYQVTAALNGREALDKLETVTPDLIISDVMMPEMDGMELTSRVKSDLKFSHIPIILLTSKSGAESKLEGMRSGADYYIEKPFYPEILEQNIDNILNTRKRLIERFKTDETIVASEVAHSESDKIFIEKLTAIIMENISNPDLDVTFLIQQLGVSRSLLHVKLKSLVGCSSTEFIRAIRLKEAVKLISSGKCNISEAAYETGFSSPTYFTRRFREFYGKSPREYFNV